MFAEKTLTNSILILWDLWLLPCNTYSPMHRVTVVAVSLHAVTDILVHGKTRMILVFFFTNYLTAHQSKTAIKSGDVLSTFS